MNTKEKKMEECKQELQIEVPQQAVSEEFERVFKEFQKHANIKGFRPGKAPLDMVKKQYAKLAEEEVIKSLVPEYYRKAVEKDKLSVASYPEISDVKINEGKLTFKAAFDVRPDVKLKNYKGLKVASSKIEVKDAEVNEALESIRKKYAANAPKDKEKMEELPKLDDDFAKEIGFKDLADLKLKLNEQLLAQSKHRASLEERRQVVGHLLEGADFSVPQSWTKSQFAHVLNNTKINLLMSGVKKEELDTKIKEQEKELEKQAQNNVRLFFILEKIAEKENIQIEEKEIESYVKSMALKQGVTEGQMKEYFDKKNLWEDLLADLRQEKVIDFIIKEAKKE